MEGWWMSWLLSFDDDDHISIQLSGTLSILLLLSSSCETKWLIYKQRCLLTRQSRYTHIIIGNYCCCYYAIHPKPWSGWWWLCRWQHIAWDIIIIIISWVTTKLQRRWSRIWWCDDVYEDQPMMAATIRTRLSQLSSWGRVSVLVSEEVTEKHVRVAMI